MGFLYVLASGERIDRGSAPVRAAWEIERLAALKGWPTGEMIGSEASLRERLKVSRETLREAIRIVEGRGAMRMRRGRSGGLMLVCPTIERTAASLAAYLRVAGLAPEQFAQCVHGLDQLLAWQLVRKPGELPPRRRREGLRHWLARASGRQTYQIYISALDKLAPPASDTQGLPAGLERALAERDPAAFVSALAEVPFRPSPTLLDTAEFGTHARAGLIAMRMVECARCRQTDNLGNEASLCEEFVASRSLVRQALRILQDLDLIEVRRGRGGGYMLKQPSPIGIIRQLFAWLAARNCCPLALNELLWDLHAANLWLAGERLAAMPAAERNLHCDRFTRIVTKLRGQERFISLQHALARVADCPMIDTLARCVVSYQARSYGDFPDGDVSPVFDMLERMIVAALRTGDVNLAEQALRELQDRAYEIRLGSFGLAVAAE